MLSIANAVLHLAMNEDGTQVVLEDRVRMVRWRLDESTRLAARDVAHMDFKAYAHSGRTAPESKVMLLGRGEVQRRGEHVLESRHETGAGPVVLRWELERDRLRVTAHVLDHPQAATALSLPGTFRPDGEAGFLSAVPSCQGILHSGKGPDLYRPLFSRGHPDGFTMAMFGQIGSRGALVSIAENESDASLHWEKADRAMHLMWMQHPSMGQLSYDREVVLMATAPDLTSLCKAYRRYEIEHGRFKSWDEKLEARPQLNRLFGGAMLFLGYLQDEELDYIDCLRRLKQMGVEKGFIYPVYADTTMNVEEALQIKWIDIRQHAPLLDELGYAAASFIYVMDGPAGGGEDPHAELLLDREGNPTLFWQMRDLRWYVLGHPQRMQWARRMLDEQQRGLHGVHYDVLTSCRMREDYNPRHRADVRGDIAGRREMLQHAAGKGLIVSSEGFWGRMADTYDLGNSKWPLAMGGEEYCVVPMTMLVYHDSAYHVWWEPDNYNNPEHRTQGRRGYSDRYTMGGGHMRQQALMDALMGTPPDLFPFGKMYCFVPRNNPQIYTYRYRLEDRIVQEAIAFARPVMKLNERIGKLELAEHKLHGADASIQESVFADGTRVIANFANVAQEAPSAGLMGPESWRVLEHG